MRGRMRRLYIVAIGIALSGSVHAQTVGQSASGNTSASNSQTKPAQNAPPVIPATVQSDISRIAGALETASGKPETVDEKNNAIAQVEIAWWTPWIFGAASFEALITAIGVGLVGFTLYYTKRAAEAAERAVKVTRNVGRAEVRAYVQISRTSYDPDGMAFHVKNFGSTPAHGLCFWFETESRAHSDKPPQFERKDAPLTTKGAIAPTADFVFGRPLKKRMEPGEVLYVWGVITYRDAFKVDRTTKFSYWAPRGAGEMATTDDNNTAT